MKSKMALTTDTHRAQKAREVLALMRGHHDEIRIIIKETLEARSRLNMHDVDSFDRAVRAVTRLVSRYFAHTDLEDVVLGWLDGSEAPIVKKHVDRIRLQHVSDRALLRQAVATVNRPGTRVDDLEDVFPDIISMVCSGIDHDEILVAEIVRSEEHHGL